MDAQSVIAESKKKMNKAVEHTLHEFSTIHTGKASPTMVETVTFEAYGSSMRIKDSAAITTPDPRTIVIQPWDKGILNDIVRGIQQANIGLNPVADSGVIRCPIPELSGDRRAELVKSTHTMAENGRVGVRSARRDALDFLKKMQKEGEISEDDYKRLEKEVQAETDKHVAEIGSHLEEKEKELKKV